MEINASFYKTALGQKVSSIIQKTGKLLLDRRYQEISAENIKTDLSDGWISSMNEMLDSYSAKLLPWKPNKGSQTRVTVETDEYFVIEAPLFEEENDEIAESDIYMIFDFKHDGGFTFDGIHY